MNKLARSNDHELATSDVTVAPPRFDEEAEALLEAASYDFHNPEANDRVRATRARRVGPDRSASRDD